MAESESIASTCNTFPTMQSQETEEWPADATYSDNQAETTEVLPHTDQALPENTATTEDDDEPTHGCEESVTATEPSPITNTPMPTPPLGCSTECTSAATPPVPTKRNVNQL